MENLFTCLPFPVYEVLSKIYLLQVSSNFERYRTLIIFAGIVIVAGFLLWRRQRKEGSELAVPFILRTGRLNLDFESFMTHYGPVIYVLLLSFLFLSFLLDRWMSSGALVFVWKDVPFVILPLLLAQWLYRRQYKKLFFHAVPTDLTREELLPVIRKTAYQLDWILDYEGDDLIVAHTEAGFLRGSWGEQIFIVFDKRQVWINSICDLNKKSSITSLGRNKKNIKSLTEAIKRAAGNLPTA